MGVVSRRWVWLHNGTFSLEYNIAYFITNLGGRENFTDVILSCKILLA